MEDPNIETRPLSWFLQNRTKAIELEEKVEKRKKRLGEKKKKEELRRLTLYDKKKKKTHQDGKSDLIRIESFLGHSHKSIVSSIKSYDSLPKDFRSSREYDFLVDITKRIEHFQKRMAKKSQKMSELESSDSEELKKLVQKRNHEKSQEKN